MVALFFYFMFKFFKILKKKMLLLIKLSLCFCVIVKLIGKLQDGAAFLKKGHDEEEKLFEFKTDEGNLKSASVLIPLHPLFMFFWSNKFIVLR